MVVIKQLLTVIMKTEHPELIPPEELNRTFQVL
jgi:hypothetical protein